MKVLALLMLSSAAFAQAKSTKPPTPVSATHKSEESQAHDSVMKFLLGLRMAAMQEGKSLLAETQWILGTADRGQNFYSRPDYTEVTPIYAALFDTDIPSVKGYKELFDMKAVTNAGTSRSLKYLAICFKDIAAGKWKILTTLDNVDDETGNSLDTGAQAEFFKKRLAETKYDSPRANYASYGRWLLCSGHINEASSALGTAKTVSGTSDYDISRSRQPDPVRDIQIAALLEVIAKITPNGVVAK
jgi:hypothetical protein